ncbi:hypothetical protein V8G54_034982 [Vigna mungo]|uniref:Uncharacterized protein n=1 Tax=Vigna mungo TaxID=3915 RepID=A0AAQ3MEW0_VIGMU
MEGLDETLGSANHRDGTPLRTTVSGSCRLRDAECSSQSFFILSKSSETGRVTASLNLTPSRLSSTPFRFSTRRLRHSRNRVSVGKEERSHTRSVPAATGSSRLRFLRFLWRVRWRSSSGSVREREVWRNSMRARLVFHSSIGWESVRGVEGYMTRLSFTRGTRRRPFSISNVFNPSSSSFLFSSLILLSSLFTVKRGRFLLSYQGQQFLLFISAIDFL